MLKILTRIFVGIRRRWRKAVVNAFAVIGGIWLLTEIVTRSSKAANVWLDTNGDAYLWAIGLASLITFVAYACEPRRVTFKLPTTGTKVSLAFGNLFEAGTDIVVSVNEFFDTEIGQLVAKASLHGQVIEHLYGGDQQRFRNEVDAALAGHVGTAKARTGSARTTAYPIGTTIRLPQGNANLFLVALARTDPLTAKATCDLPDYWCALQGVLDVIHHQGNGAPVTFPLLGNGRSGLNIEPQHLLRFLTLGLVNFGRTNSLPNPTSIMLPEECFDALDLREIARDWSIK